MWAGIGWPLVEYGMSGDKTSPRSPRWAKMRPLLDCLTFLGGIVMVSFYTAPPTNEFLSSYRGAYGWKFTRFCNSPLTMNTWNSLRWRQNGYHIILFSLDAFTSWLYFSAAVGDSGSSLSFVQFRFWIIFGWKWNLACRLILLFA